MGAGILVIALIVLASVLSHVFGDVGGGLKGDQLGLNPTTSAPDAAAAGSAVKPVRVTVFSPEGGADNPGQADKALNSSPGAGWATDVYTDPMPFPNFKNGVGLILQLSQPATVGSVTVNVNSTGTAVQIRSSDSASPSSLEDTTALTEPTTLKPGSNTIEVNATEPTSNVLVWVSTLGSVGGESRSDVAEITLNAAS